MASGVLKSSFIAARNAAGRRRLPVEIAGRQVQAVERGVEAPQGAARVVEIRIAEIDRAAVVRAQHEEAERLAVVSLQHVADREEVSERLRHLLVVDRQVSVVQPVVDERPAVRRLALRDLVLMVRELEVDAPAVDVEVLTEQRLAHRRAFDVPARTARAIDAVPFRVVRFRRLRRLPEHEVERILLAVEHGDALAGTKLVDRLARKLAVAGELAHRVVDVAAVGAIGQPLRLRACRSSSACPRHVRSRAARGSAVRCRARRGRRAWPRSSLPSVRRIGMPRSSARRMILSSMSVMLRT